MFIPFLSVSNGRYTRLDLLNWARGNVVSSLLQLSMAESLAELCGELAEHQILTVNCRGFSKVQHHALDALVSTVKAGPRTVVFDRVETGLYADLSDIFKGMNVLTYPGNATSRSLLVTTLGQMPAFDFAANQRIAEVRLNQHVAQAIKSSFVEFKDGTFHRLRLTPIEATGYFDSRLIVGDPEKLVWVAARMADVLSGHIDAHSDSGNYAGKELRFLAVSRSAIALAAALDWLVRSVRGVDVVDHFGPWQEVIEEHLQSTDNLQCQHIYVGDFIIGGTEIKVAQAYATQSRSELCLACVVAGVLEPPQYQLSFPLLTIADPLSKLVPEARYRFGG